MTRRSFRLSFCLGAALVGALLIPGCRTTGSTTRPAGPQRSAASIEARKNTEQAILDVVAYYTTPIRWRYTPDRTRVHGVIVGALYLMGPHGKGVFGDGDIHPQLFVRDPNIRDPQKQWQLVKEWRFTCEEMMPMRTASPSIQGNGYMLPLDWGDLDLSNRQILIVVGYHRTDGMPDPRTSTKELVVPGVGT